MLRQTCCWMFLYVNVFAAQNVVPPDNVSVETVSKVGKETSEKPAESEDSRPVAARDPWAIQIDGLSSFQPDPLRRSLWGDAEFRGCLRQSSSDEQFRKVLKERLLAGFSSSGFPEATVSVPESAGAYSVQIQEGPEYTWGDLRIDAPADTDVRYFTETLNRMKKTTLSLERTPLGWRGVGQAKTNSKTEASIVTLMQSVAKLDGRHEFECRVRFETDSTTKKISPVVTFINPGYHALISEVVTKGLHANTTEDLCQYLKISPGQRYDGHLRDRIANELISSGHFLAADSATDVPFASDHAVPLMITVREYDINPKLSQTATCTELAVVKLAQWANNWSHPDEQIELKLNLDMTALYKKYGQDSAAEANDANKGSATPGTILGFDPLTFLGQIDSGKCDVRLISAPQRGTVLEHKAVDGTGHCRSDISIILAPKTATLVEWGRQQKWTHRGYLPGATVMVSLLGIPDETHEDRTKLMLGVVSTSVVDVPLSPAVQFNPTGLIHLIVDGGKPTGYQEENGTIRISGEEFELELDSASGRLKTLKYSDEGIQLEGICTNGLIDSVTNDIMSRSQEYPDLYREGHMLSSFAQFIAPRVRASFVPSDSKIPEVVDRVLNNAESIDGLTENLMAAFSGDEFEIPHSSQTATANVSLPWMLQWLESAAPGGSTLDRLMALTGQDDKDHTEVLQEFIQELAQNEAHGPLDCWLTATLFPAVSQQAAAIGLTRLDAGHFLGDLEPFLNDKWAGGRMAVELVVAIQSMSDDQAELLATAVDEITTPRPPADAGAPASNAPPVNSSARQNIRPILTLIRSQSTVPPREVLNSLPTLAWNAGAREYVQQTLLAAAARSKNQPPVNTVSWPFLEIQDSSAADRAALQEQFDKIKVE